MWPMPPGSNTFVTINFSPHHLSCCWFEQMRNQKQCTLKAYQTTELENSELEHLIIFNPSHITTFIKKFLDTIKLTAPFALFCLNGPSVFEQYIAMKSATPGPGQFSIPDRSKLIWDYMYLYPTPQGQFIFYVTGIKRDLLLQYQLVALRSNLNLVAIAPSTMALFNLYKHKQGTQFRHSQLGIDLANNDNHVEDIINKSFVNRTLTFDQKLTIDFGNESRFILPAFGLFLMRNKNDAYHQFS